MELLRDWYNIIARNNQLAMLLVLLAVGTAFVVVTAGILAPFYGAVTIAYVMDVAMRGLQRRGVSRGGSLTIVYGIFVAVILALFGLLPVLGRQLAQFARPKLAGPLAGLGLISEAGALISHRRADAADRRRMFGTGRRSMSDRLSRLRELRGAAAPGRI